MAFNPQTINKELDMANLAKHNANYSAIKTELDTQASAASTHTAAQTAHGSTSEATAGRIMQRDSAGRAKVAAPSASDDIARKAEVDAVQTNLDGHEADSVAHLSTSDREKLDGLQVGAEANQNAFAQVNNVVAGAESDTLTIAGGTGITVTTNPTTKTLTVTATGDATPGAHGSSHDNDGADPIPDLVALRDSFDALTPADIGAETPEGAQEKVDALGDTVSDRFTEVQKKTGGLLDPREFGAVGDGVVDDTAALQAWLESPGKSKVLRNGIFKISSTLISNEPGRSIITEGAVLLAAQVDMTVLTVRGSGTRITVEINGDSKAACGIVIEAPLCEVKSSTIQNMYGTGRGSVGIDVKTPGGVIVTRNTIRNIDSRANGVIGDNIGSSRAILISANESATSLNVVEDNYIDRVVGEEGDAIQFLFFTGSILPFLDGKGIIRGNTIINCSRRAIKVQASNCKIKNNEHMNTLAEAELPNAAVLIDVIQSDDVTVQDNYLDAAYFMGMQITGASAYRARRCTLKGNTVKSGSSKNAVFLDNIQDCIIEGNVLYDGQTGVAIQNSQQTTIDSNIFHGGDSSRVAINIVASNSTISARGNLLMSGARLYLVQNAAPNCIVENNHTRAGVGGNIRTFATSAGTVYRNNSSNSGTPTVIGDFTDQFLFASRNISTGTSGIPDVMFSSSAPSLTTHPTKRFNVGDIVFSTTPVGSGKIGWVCTSGGTPGTWKAFGAIDA